MYIGGEARSRKATGAVVHAVITGQKLSQLVGVRRQTPRSLPQSWITVCGPLASDAAKQKWSAALIVVVRKYAAAARAPLSLTGIVVAERLERITSVARDKACRVKLASPALAEVAAAIAA